MNNTNNNVNSTFPKTHKKIIIAEKPSVAMSYAAALNTQLLRYDGYLEGDEWIVTWAVGHLVTMSYPEKYDEAYKNWNLDDLPFIPQRYLYETLPNTKDQFNVIKGLYNRPDIDAIYYAGDSAREGLYIQMLIRMMAGHNPNAKELVVWIDSQTMDEIRKGIREAKPLSAYTNMSASGFIRAIEDYSTGINISRALTCKYQESAGFKGPIAVGRVMTCVQGMVVEREREIKNFVATKFFKVKSRIQVGDGYVEAEWKASPEKPHNNMYGNNGFLNKEDAENFAAGLPRTLSIEKLDIKNKNSYADQLFSLASLQSTCSKLFHISPDQTLQTAQRLYEAKLTTYPRTDARVLSTAVAKEIGRNISGLSGLPKYTDVANRILAGDPTSIIGSKRYVDDSKISDHYAIIPTGQNLSALSAMSDIDQSIYHLIASRFLAIFMPPAVYKKVELVENCGGERFYAGGSTLIDPGYMALTGIPNGSSKLPVAVESLQPGQQFPCQIALFAGETTPPNRYTSGSMITAMENAGNSLEEETLKGVLKDCGIGTSSTRAAIIKKLDDIGYISINKKTQIMTPTDTGIAIYEIIKNSIPELLNPKITAQWEEGLNGIVKGQVNPNEYQNKIHEYVRNKVNDIKNMTISDDFSAYIKTFNIETKKKPNQKKVEAEAYLNVPYEDKDKVKELGAFFDMKNKMWFVPKGRSTEPFAKWLTNAKTVKKIRLDVPFEDKDAVKSLGARWDKDRKTWYILSTMDKNTFSKWIPKDGNTKMPASAANAKKIAIKVPFDDKDEVKSLGARWDKDHKTWYILSTMDKTKFAKWLK